MRIALLTHQWPGARMGGIGVYTAACARGLARAGHEVHVFTLRLPADVRRGFPAGVVLHEVEVRRPEGISGSAVVSGELMYRRAMAASLAEAVARVHRESVRFDIVEAPEYEALGEKLHGALRDECVPVITHVHSGSAIAREVGNVANDAEQMLREAMELEAIVGSDGVCAPSRAVIEDTRRAYEMEGLATEAEVIPLPVDLPEVQSTLPAKDAPVLYVGRLELLKGAHLLAQATALFLRKNPRATLRIVGPDTMTAPAVANEPGAGRSMWDWMRGHLGPELGARVTFLGECTRGQIEAELQGCSFLVCPSLRESYSYVCCEALAGGRAVVVSSGIGATEVVGPAGLIFRREDAGDLAEKMEGLWGDDELRVRLSRVAWERARGALSSEGAIAQRVAFYEKIIDCFRKEGRAVATQRVKALPESHTVRMRLARAFSEGKEVDEMAALMRIAGLQGEIITPGARLVGRLESKVHGSEKGVGFYLYGAGRHTARLLMEKGRWEGKGHRLLGLIDDNARFVEMPECFGLPVMSVAAAVGRLAGGDVVVLSTDTFEDQFWKQTEPLRALGVTIYRLYS